MEDGIDKVVTKTLTIKLNEEEAHILKELVQNAQMPDEPKRIEQVRKRLFRACEGMD